VWLYQQRYRDSRIASGGLSAIDLIAALKLV